jgi:uncharacterized protein YegL
MPIDLSKTPLADKYAAAGVSLQKKRLDGVRAAVYLVLDFSRSMRGFYRDGSVQHLTEQILALAAHFDDDGSVPVILFDSYAREPVNVSVDDFAGSIGRIVAQAGTMGSTNYASAMHMVIGHHRVHGGGQPAFVIFQTDGSPDSKSAAEQTLCAAATMPIFWQFIGFGDDEFKFLRKLDDLKVPRKRVVDNAGFFPAGFNPKGIPDGVLYDNLMSEFPQWLTAYGRYALGR